MPHELLKRIIGEAGGRPDARSDRWQREECREGTPREGKRRPTVRVSSSGVCTWEDGTLLDMLSVSGGFWPESGRRLAWRLRLGPRPGKAAILSWTGVRS